MRILGFFVISMVLVACSDTKTSVHDDLVFFANNYQLISETENKVPTLSARIFKLREFGECDSGKCPKEYVYIALSEFGEFPQQKLYVSNGAHEWQFLEWVEIPALGDKDRTLIFKMKGILNNIETKYIVVASLEGIEFKEQ